MEHWKWQPDISVPKMRSEIPDSLYNSRSWYRLHLSLSACSPRNHMQKYLFSPWISQDQSGVPYKYNIWWPLYVLVNSDISRILQKQWKIQNLTCVPHFSCQNRIHILFFSHGTTYWDHCCTTKKRWLKLQVPHFLERSLNWNHFFFSRICELCSLQIAHSWATKCTSKLCILV